MDSTQSSVFNAAPFVPATQQDMFYCNIQTLYNNVVANYEQMKFVVSQTQHCNMQMAQDIAFLRQERSEPRTSQEEGGGETDAWEKVSYEKEEEENEKVEQVVSDLDHALGAVDLRLSEITDVFSLTLLKKDVEINSLKLQLSGVERDCEARLKAKDQEVEFHRADGAEKEGVWREQYKTIDKKTKEVVALNAKVSALEAELQKAGNKENSKLVKLQAEHKAAVDRLATATARGVVKDERISDLVANLSSCEDRAFSLQADSKKQAETLKRAQEEVISLSLELNTKLSLCTLKDEELEAKDNLLTIKDKELKALRSSVKAVSVPVPVSVPVIDQAPAAKVVVFKKDNRDKIIAHLCSQVQMLATFVKSNLSIIHSAVAPLEKSVRAMVKKTKTLSKVADDSCSKIRVVMKAMDVGPKMMTAEMKTDLAQLHRFIETKFEATELDPNTKIAFSRLDAQKLGEMLGLMIRRLNDVKSEVERVKTENQKLGLAIKFTIHLHTQSLIGMLQEKIEEDGEKNVDLYQFLQKLKQLLLDHRVEMQNRVKEELQKCLMEKGIQSFSEEW